MDVAFILDKYFKGMDNVSIDVFDAQTLNAVYRDVVNAMTSHFEIEVSVLQALSYCLYEMMDNVHIHSGKPLGTARRQHRQGVYPTFWYAQTDYQRRRDISHREWILARNSYLYGNRHGRGNRPKSDC